MCNHIPWKRPCQPALIARCAGQPGCAHPIHSQIDADLEKEKALKRAERFGIEHPELEAIKKEQRAARFGIVDEETKKKQRLDKFKPLPAGGGGAKDKPDFNVAIKSDDDFEAKRKVG